MADLRMVFRGVYNFCLDFPRVTRYGIRELFGFKAALYLSNLGWMQGDSAIDFSYGQAIAVLAPEGCAPYPYDDVFVLVRPDAVRWVLCFPVARRKTTGKYDLQTNTIDPCVVRDSCGNPVFFIEIGARRLSSGDRAFFCFSSATNALLDGESVWAAVSEGALLLLSPQPGDKLALVRAREWKWDEGRNTALIRPQDVIEMEIIPDSEVRIF